MAKLHLNYEQIETLNEDDIKSENFQNAKYLYLNRNVMTTLPQSINLLTGLRQLYVEGNNLKDLPEEIGDLHSLEVFNVVSNGLTRLPASIGGMKCLRKLQISSNKIKCLPNEIGDLQCLETLEASNNNLSNIPISLAYCTQLKLLALDKNKLTLFPRQLGRLKKLTELSLAGNQLEYLPPMIFDELSSLHSLVLDQNPGIRAYPPHHGNVEISQFGFAIISDSTRERFQQLVIQGQTISMPEEFEELCKPGKRSVPCLQELSLRSLQPKMNLNCGNLGDLLPADLVDRLVFPTSTCYHCGRMLFMSSFPVIYKDINKTDLTSAFCCSVKCIKDHNFSQYQLLYPL